MSSPATGLPDALPATGEWPQIPVPRDGTVLVGRSNQADVVLHHVSVSRQHARLSRTGDQLMIEDLDTRFGTFVNGVRVRQTSLHIGDLVRFGGSPPYRFDGTRLTAESEAIGMALNLVHVSVARGGRTLLNDITLSIPGGGCVGVLGPSGAGKSLLLGCLASTITPTGGTITFDDNMSMRNELDYFRSRIGIVTQDDLVYRPLTVAENLCYAARLRRPALSNDQRQQLVDATLRSVGLSEHRAKLVQIVSGGQRKRVSVAIELLLRPRLLLLDEPTTGLDPGLQARLMDMLRGLTRQGITVVCSTHTMDTLHYFDQVAVIGVQNGVGRLAYSGPPGELLAAFAVRTAADLFDRLQAGGAAELPLLGHTTASGGAPAKPDTGSATRRRTPLAFQRPVTEPPRLLDQAVIVFQRSFLSFWRDRVACLFAVLQPVVLALLVVLSQHDQSISVFVHFFLIVSILWLGMTLTVREIVRERSLYVRDRLAGLQPDAYLGGKLAFAGAILVVQAVLLWSTARMVMPWLVPLRHGMAYGPLLNTSPVLALGVLFLVGLGGSLVGLGISTLARSERAAVALLPLALLPQVMLSRVAFGHGDRGWADASPFGLVTGMSAYFHDQTCDWKGILAWIASLPMLTRPGTAVLDVPAASAAKAGALVAEWAYFVLLLLIYALALYALFRQNEHRWPALR